jgi:hypothetical protein
MVTQVKNSGNADDVYAFELWNEPNGTWQGVNGNGHDSGWGDFYQVWRDTYHTVKSIMPDTKIVGPSLNSWQPNYMKGFLTMARDSNTLPDIVSWHQWGQLHSLSKQLTSKPWKIPWGSNNGQSA